MESSIIETELSYISMISPFVSKFADVSELFSDFMPDSTDSTFEICKTAVVALIVVRSNLSRKIMTFYQGSLLLLSFSTTKE